MNALVEFALRQRVLVLMMFIVMLAGGVVAFRLLNIEAYPESDPAHGRRRHAKPGPVRRGD